MIHTEGYFEGLEPRQSNRAPDTQACKRVSGKTDTL